MILRSIHWVGSVKPWRVPRAYKNRAKRFIIKKRVRPPRTMPGREGVFSGKAMRLLPLL
jgi:hypothetical protein